MADKAKAKGRKIGRNSKKASTQRGKDRYNRAQDNRAKRILNLILNGNPKTKHKIKPKLTDQKDGTAKIQGYPGYLYVGGTRTLIRKHAHTK